MHFISGNVKLEGPLPTTTTVTLNYDCRTTQVLEREDYFVLFPFRTRHELMQNTAWELNSSSHTIDVLVLFFKGGRETKLNGDPILLNGRVVAPRWYWKAVCDPVLKQSIFFRAENHVGEKDKDTVLGCFGKVQTERRGIINCMSLKKAKDLVMENFDLPDFHEKNCNPSVIGEGFKPYILNSDIK